jgi:preprotein translocase subunit SecF
MVDPSTVAAIRAIIGYSVNDTIIVFDRMRENTRKIRRQSLEKVINETLSRTILTSLTTLIVVLALFVLGGLGHPRLSFCDDPGYRRGDVFVHLYR